MMSEQLQQLERINKARKALLDGAATFILNNNRSFWSNIDNIELVNCYINVNFVTAHLSADGISTISFKEDRMVILTRKGNDIIKETYVVDIDSDDIVDIISCILGEGIEFSNLCDV